MIVISYFSKNQPTLDTFIQQADCIKYSQGTILSCPYCNLNLPAIWKKAIISHLFTNKIVIKEVKPQRESHYA